MGGDRFSVASYGLNGTTYSTNTFLVPGQDWDFNTWYRFEISSTPSQTLVSLLADSNGASIFTDAFPIGLDDFDSVKVAISQRVDFSLGGRTLSAVDHLSITGIPEAGGIVPLALAALIVCGARFARMRNPAS